MKLYLLVAERDACVGIFTSLELAEQYLASLRDDALRIFDQEVPGYRVGELYISVARGNDGLPILFSEYSTPQKAIARGAVVKRLEVNPAIVGMYPREKPKM